MTTRDEIRRIKKSCEKDVIVRRGVTAMATGYKIVGGKTTDELCVRVYVEQKKDVPAKDRIPKTIDGVKTDVIQRKYIANPLRIRVAELRRMADTGTYDPLRGGISIGPCRGVQRASGNRP